MNLTRDRRRRRAVVAVVAGALATLLTTTGMSGLPASSPDSAPAAAADTTTRTALTEAAAQAAAAESGDRVEVASLRDERTETFANPDGTFTAKEYAQPVRTRKDGEWVNIDTTLARQSNGWYSPRAATTGMAFSAGGTNVFATIERAGKTMSVAWPTKLPAPVIAGSTATYADALPGVDLVVTALDDGFSHVLVVKTPAAATNPDLATIELPVRTDGVELKTQGDGGLVARDTGAGGPVFEAPQPIMWDSGRKAATATTATPSTGADQRPSAETVPLAPPVTAVAADKGAAEAPQEGAKIADVGLAVRSDAIVLTPDAGLLKSEDTVYPVYIDPVTRTSSRSGWTMVSSYYSSAEFWKFSDHEGVGRCPADVSYTCASSNDVKRQFFAIPTSAYQGKHIISAEFAVTMVHTYSSSAKSVQLGRVNSGSGSAISSSTNWGNQPSLKETIDSKSPTNPAGSCTSTNQNVRFTVTSTVQKAADNDWSTTTFRLRAGDEGEYSYWKRFCGNANLEVTYNRPPLQPKMSELTMDYGGSCEYGAASQHYASQVPTLKAIIRDWDHHDIGSNTEQLKAEFKVYWTSGGTTKVYLSRTDYKTSNSDASNSQLGYETFKFHVGDDLTGDGEPGYTIPSDGTTIAWEVRGYDGSQWGPWSSSGDAATRCEFKYDVSKPKPPVVTSAAYPDDDQWHDGVGDYGSFTLDSASTDVTQYKYRFTGQSTWTTVDAASAGGPATIRWMPEHEGPFVLEAKAVDVAGNTQETAFGHQILVNSGRAPKAAWTLGEPSGSSQAAGSGSSATPATAGSGVTFGTTGLGDRPSEVGATLDGTGNAYLAASAPAVNTASTFSVGAWVYLPELPSRSMTVVSQDGTAEPGFMLGYSAGTKQWSFRAPVSEIDSLGTWNVTGGNAVAKTWTHLIGVYDGDMKEMRLYVNGALIADDIQTRQAAWNARGALQIGRHLSLSGYTANLKGTVADVKLYDRVIPEGEGHDLGGIPPRQLAYWPLNETVSGVSPENAGGTGLTLSGASSIYVPDDSCDITIDPECPPVAEPLWGDGHLELDGTSDTYASRAAGLLPAEGSFTLTARVRLASPAPGRDEAVITLPGTTARAVVVRYSATDDRWQLAVTDKDDAAATTTTGIDTQALPTAAGDGDYLAFTYDAVLGEARLYVNGQLAGAQAVWRNTWDFSKAKVEVGRTPAGEYFSGAVDEVRVYQGALDQSTVGAVMSLPSTSDLAGGSS